MGSLFNITFITECIGLIASLFLLDYKTGYWQLFKLFLFIIVSVESAGWYISHAAASANNSWIYNLLLIISGAFTLWIIHTSEPLENRKQIFRWLVAIYLIFAVGNIFFLQGYRRYNGYTEMVQDIFISVYCCYFFYRALEEEIYRDLFRFEYFWMAVGFFFSALGSVVLYMFIDALSAYYTKTHIDLYGHINAGLNMVLYSCLIISFICRRMNTRS